MADGQDELVDSTLDFCSLEFDPLKALQVDQSLITLPFPEVSACYSLKHYEEIMKRKHVTYPSKRETTEDDRMEDKPRPIPKPRVQSILQFMPEQKDGPLSFLRDAMANKKVVNVWIRHSAGLRGVCTGKIRAFDKHWNIVMFDVMESFTPIRTFSNGGKERQKRERVKRVRGRKKKKDQQAFLHEKQKEGPLGCRVDQKSSTPQDSEDTCISMEPLQISTVSSISELPQSSPSDSVDCGLQSLESVPTSTQEKQDLSAQEETKRFIKKSVEEKNLDLGPLRLEHSKKTNRSKRQESKNLSSSDLRYKLRGSRSTNTAQKSKQDNDYQKKSHKELEQTDEQKSGSIATKTNWERTRYVKQLFVRGDNIMIITTCK